MESWHNNLRIIRNILFIKFFILILYIFYSLSSIFIPLVFAFFLALVLQPSVSWFQSKGISLGLSIVIISMGFLGILVLVDLVIYDTLKGLLNQKEQFLERINTGLLSITISLSELTSYNLEVENIVDSMQNLLTQDWLLKHTGSFAGKLGNFSGNLLITILYFVGMLGAISQYKKYISYLESDRNIKEEEQANLVSAYMRIQHAIGTYIKVKTFTSFLTGLGYAIVCYFFGIDFYLLWGFLAFSLNFIPAIGSVVSTIPPVLMGLMYFDNSGLLIILILLLAGIQIVIGSILDPKMMGASLSLNFVTVVLGIVFWGTLWGTAGMILSVPMMVLLKIILEQLPDANILVKLMEPQKVDVSYSSVEFEKKQVQQAGVD